MVKNRKKKTGFPVSIKLFPKLSFGFVGDKHFNRRVKLELAELIWFEILHSCI